MSNLKKTTQSKRVVYAAARLAVFALSCHEALVGTGDHVDQLPPQIDAMAAELGMTAQKLLGIGWELNRGGKPLID